MSRDEGFAYPDPAQAGGAAARINRENRERYLELWDAGDEYDEHRSFVEIIDAEWDARDNPTRPRDEDLLP